MGQNKKEGIFREAMNGMCSMTLPVFLFFLMFYLFPRFAVCLMLIVSIPFIWRLLPKVD